MLSESSPWIRRIIRFLLLPFCYVKLVNWKECTKSKPAVALDFLYIFFILRDYPDHYGACRLWERPRKEWALYFGSNYNPHQKARLRKEVNPLPLQLVYNDKHVCDVLCRGIKAPLPSLLGIIEPRDSPAAKLLEIFHSTGVGEAMVKPVHGHAGIGVMHARRQGDGIVLSRGREVIPAAQVRLTEKCIVQEVVQQHSAISQFAPSSVNTIRVLTMLDASGRAVIIAASMRFGVGTSVVDNWSAGGVAVGVDVDTGRLLRMAYDKLGNRYTTHPASGIAFEGFPIPFWNAITGLSMRVQRELPFNRMLGLDVAVTQEGVVLIEVNPDADVMFQEQTSGALFARRHTWEMFKEYGLLFNSAQRRLYA